MLWQCWTGAKNIPPLSFSFFDLFWPSSLVIEIHFSIKKVWRFINISLSYSRYKPKSPKHDFQENVWPVYHRKPWNNVNFKTEAKGLTPPYWRLPCLSSLLQYERVEVFPPKIVAHRRLPLCLVHSFLSGFPYLIQFPSTHNTFGWRDTLLE